MANREIVSFVELRQAVLGMQEFSEAALRFMERNGIGLGGPRVTRKSKPRANGAGLVERVKRHYVQHRGVQRAVATGPATRRPPKRRGSGAEKIRQQREKSAALLAQLDQIDVRQLGPEFSKHIGSLVRRGYVKKKGDGYLRTAKGFLVKAGAAPPSNGPRETPAPSEALTVAQAAKRLKMSDANVRLLLKAKKISGETELRVRRGMKKPAPMIVVQPDEIARYLAQQM